MSTCSEHRTETKRYIETVSLRPHHALCMQFFEGKGYSPAFVDKMGEVCELPGSAVVCITGETDDLCAACPNREGEICTAGDKVDSYDGAVAELCGFEEGAEMTLEEFKERAKRQIIDRKKLHVTCSDCKWYDLCSNHSKYK